MALNCRAWFILLNRPGNRDGFPAWLSIAGPGLFSLNRPDNRARCLIPNGRACAADAPAGKRPGAARRPYRPGNGEPCRAGVSGANIARFRTH